MENAREKPNEEKPDDVFSPEVSVGDTIVFPFPSGNWWTVAEIREPVYGFNVYGFNKVYMSKIGDTQTREEALIFAESLGRKAVEFPFEIDIAALERTGKATRFERRRPGGL